MPIIPRYHLTEIKACGETPLVTVIIPTHNRAHLLPRSVQSVLDQTFSNFELIIVDDCSTDETAEVAKRLCALDARVRYIRNAVNLDAQASRNRAVSLAQGEFVAFNDDDDVWLPDKLELQLPLAERYSVVGCRPAFDNIPHRRPLSDKYYTHYRTKTLEQFFFSNREFSPTKLITKKSHYQTVGGFDSKLPGPEGIDLVARLIKHFGDAAFVDRVLAVHFTNHECDRITTSDRMIQGCINEFEKNKQLRSPAAQRFRLAQMELMKMGRTRSIRGSMRHCLAAVRLFQWSHAVDHMRLYRNALATGALFRWALSVYWRFKYR